MRPSRIDAGLGRGERSDNTDASSNGIRSHQQYANAAVSERTDQMVAGYLQRMGYNQAAAALAQESPFIPDSNRQSVVIINDRLHDSTLESIIQSIVETGGFGITQEVVDIGAQLRAVSAQLTEVITSRSTTPGNNIHAQLYGRPTRSRLSSQQQLNHTRRPAPQAIAALNLQKMIELGERRHQLKSQPKLLVVDVPIDTSKTDKHQPASSEAELHQSKKSNQFIEVEDSPIESVQESGTHDGSSRRKHTQPQRLNQKATHALVEPILGFIGGRNVNEINDIEVEPFFEQYPGYEMLDYNIISALDYIPDKDGQQVSDEQEFDRVFEQIMSNAEDPTHLDQQHYDPSMLPVQEEVVIEARGEELNSLEDSDHDHQNVYSMPRPLPLISPVRCDSFPMQVEQRESNSADEQHKSDMRNSELPAPSEAFTAPTSHTFFTPMVVKSRALKESSFATAKRESREKREDVEHRKDRREGSARSSPSRRKSDEKRRHKEKEKREEKNASSMSRNREKRERNMHDTPSASLTSRRTSSSGESYRSKLQNVESNTTTPLSSRTANHDTLRKESDRKRREKEKKISDADKEKERKEKEKLKNIQKLQAQQPTSSFYNKDILGDRNVVRTEGGSDRKRKADELLNKDFKIPKKIGASSSKPDLNLKASYGSQLQSGPLVRDSLPSSSSSTKSDKRERSVEKSEKSSRKSSMPEICSGEDGPDRTRFLKPKRHIAHLSTMLVNADKKYDAFKKGLGKKDERNDNALDCGDGVSDIEDDAFSATTPSPSEPIRHSATHPKGRSFAPSKGYMLNKTMNKSPSSDDSSSDGKGEETEKESDSDSDSDSSDDRSHELKSRDNDKHGEECESSQTSSEPRKSKYSSALDDPEKINKMLDRIHK